MLLSSVGIIALLDELQKKGTGMEEGHCVEVGRRTLDQKPLGQHLTIESQREHSNHLIKARWDLSEVG